MNNLVLFCTSPISQNWYLETYCY